MLHKGLAFLTPPLGHDVFINLVPDPLPSVAIGRKRPFIGQANSRSIATQHISFE